MADEDYGIKNVDVLGDMMYALNKPEKIITYDRIARDHRSTDIRDDMDVANSTIYNYKDEFMALGWIDHELNLTDEGEFVYQTLQRLDEEYGELLYQQARDEFKQAGEEMIDRAGPDDDATGEIDQMVQDLDE